MKVKVLISNLIFDGTRVHSGSVIELDDVTALKLIKRKAVETLDQEIITDTKMEEPTKKAVRKTTKTNGKRM